MTVVKIPPWRQIFYEQTVNAGLLCSIRIYVIFSIIMCDVITTGFLEEWLTSLNVLKRKIWESPRNDRKRGKEKVELHSSLLPLPLPCGL